MLVFMAVAASGSLFWISLWSALVMASRADDEMERWAKEREDNEATGLDASDDGNVNDRSG